MLIDWEKMKNHGSYIKKTVQKPNVGFAFDLNFIRFRFPMFET